MFPLPLGEGQGEGLSPKVCEAPHSPALRTNRHGPQLLAIRRRSPPCLESR
jgi:hypothetical protein